MALAGVGPVNKLASPLDPPKVNMEGVTVFAVAPFAMAVLLTVMVTVPPHVAPHSSTHSKVALYVPAPVVANVQLLPSNEPSPDDLVQPTRLSSASVAEIV